MAPGSECARDNSAHSVRASRPRCSARCAIEVRRKEGAWWRSRCPGTSGKGLDRVRRQPPVWQRSRPSPWIAAKSSCGPRRDTCRAVVTPAPAPAWSRWRPGRSSMRCRAVFFADRSSRPHGPQPDSTTPAAAPKGGCMRGAAGASAGRSFFRVPTTIYVSRKPGVNTRLIAVCSAPPQGHSGFGARSPSSSCRWSLPPLPFVFGMLTCARRTDTRPTHDRRRSADVPNAWIAIRSMGRRWDRQRRLQ